MRKWILMGIGVALAATAATAEAQLGGRLSAEPYVGYGFFGDLPDTNASLDASIAFGGRVGYQLSDQWGLYGNYQRSQPSLTGTLAGLGDRDLNVDHWSGGIEFSYVPRGGAEGMLPVLLEAGVGQARYSGLDSDFAVNLGIASAFQLSPNFAIRYGANDYISNYRGDGIVNQIFVRVGAELTF
jgi:hypothetical protein